ncbi:MAG: Gfo/Idh/MocA family oxidoreductase [Chloroflexi bacterium]|nr:Gfo/Idh/MocA family oxidoreductase [Chloroflexota bacterium]
MAGPLKVGIIGIGQRGLQHVEHLSRLQSEEEVRLVALADPFPENLGEENIQSRAVSYTQGDTALYGSAIEMLREADLDAVWFVIPPNQHRGEIELAAERGIAVFAEKPQTLFYDEAAHQAEAIRKAGVPSTAGFQMRYEPWYVALREYTAERAVTSITMVDVGGIEGHGRKLTRTEEMGGPGNRVWTANREWSGSSVVEAGIHQTDLMRYWTHDDIEWVQSAYVERDPSLHALEGDNPTAYTVVYGFRRGAVANLIFTRPGRVYLNERYDYVLTTHSQVKFEDDLVAYGYEGDAYPPAEKPAASEVRRVLAKGPQNNPMGNENSLELDRRFVESVTLGKPELLKNTFESSLNSLAAALAANVSHELHGERINLEEFTTGERFARFRKRPESL